jgi:hypothetical protein
VIRPGEEPCEPRIIATARPARGRPRLQEILGANFEVLATSEPWWNLVSALSLVRTDAGRHRLSMAAARRDRLMSRTRSLCSCGMRP